MYRLATKQPPKGRLAASLRSPSEPPSSSRRVPSCLPLLQAWYNQVEACRHASEHSVQLVKHRFQLSTSLLVPFMPPSSSRRIPSCPPHRQSWQPPLGAIRPSAAARDLCSLACLLGCFGKDPWSPHQVSCHRPSESLHSFQLVKHRQRRLFARTSGGTRSWQLVPISGYCRILQFLS